MSDEGPPLDEPRTRFDDAILTVWSQHAPELERGLAHLLGTTLSASDRAAILQQTHALAVGRQFSADRAHSELQKLVNQQALSYALANANDQAVLLLMYAQVPRLERHIERKFPGLITDEERTDIAYNAVVRAFERRRDYNPELSQPETWLAKRVEFDTLTFLREHQIAIPYDELILDERNANGSHSESVPEDTRLLVEALEKMFAHMPPKRVEALRRYLEGESYEMIAQELKTTNGNVRSHVSRGLKELRSNESQVRKLLRAAVGNPLLTILLVLSIQLWMIPIIMGAPLAHAPVVSRNTVRQVSTPAAGSIQPDRQRGPAARPTTWPAQAPLASAQSVAAAPSPAPAAPTQPMPANSYPAASALSPISTPRPGTTAAQTPATQLSITPLVAPDLPLPEIQATQPSVTPLVAPDLPSASVLPHVSPTATAVSKPINGGVPASSDPEPETATTVFSPTPSATVTQIATPSATLTPSPSPTPSVTPVGGGEPDYPACPVETRLLQTIKDGVRRDREPRTQSYTLTLSETGRLLILGYVKEGHPEACPGGAKCKQGQLFEEFRLTVDDTLVAEYNDRGDIDAWIAVGPWHTAHGLAAGQHQLNIAHLGRGSSAESVDYKLALCIAPALANQPEPSPSPATTITATGTPAVSATPTSLPVAWGKRPRRSADPSDTRDAPSFAMIGDPPRLALVLYYG